MAGPQLVCLFSALVAALSPLVSSAQSPRVDTVVRTPSAQPRIPGVGRLVPELTIGTVNGPPEYNLQSVREMLVARDGSIWILDVGNSSREPAYLRKFNQQGRFVRYVGRNGDGPGEYTTPAGLAQLPDGRVLLRDVRGNKIIVYTAEGEYSATWTFRTTYLWHVGGSGGVLSDENGIAYMPYRIRSVRDDEIERVAWVRLRSNGSIIDTILPTDSARTMYSFASVTAQWPEGGEYTAAYTAEHRQAWSPLGYMITTDPSRNSFEMRIPPAAATPLASAAGIPARWRSGNPVLSVNLPHPPVPLSGAEQRDIANYLEARVSSGTPSAPPPVVPRVKPAIEGVSFDSEGRIWLRVAMPSERYTPKPVLRTNRPAFTPFNWRAPAAYDVYDPDGTYVMRVMPPSGTYPAAVVGDAVWCVQRDSLGVNAVVRYRIAR